MNSVTADADGITALRSIMLVPQILAILRAKDVSGLAAPTIYLNVVASACSTVYSMHQGHIVSNSMALFVQNIVVMGLLCTYRQPDLVESTKRTLAELVGTAITVAYIMPPEEHWFLASAAKGLNAVASIPQFVLNVQQGHTGRLSMVSLVLQLAGALVAVGSSTQAPSDQTELLAQAMTLVLEAALVLQVLYYWKATNNVAATMNSPVKKTD